MVRKVGEFYKRLNTVLDVRRLIQQEKKRHENLLEETEELTKKLKLMEDKYEHYSVLYSGLSELKLVTPTQANDKKILSVLKQEI